LTRVLRQWASKPTIFSVAQLHAEMLTSLKEVPPRHIVEDSVFEWRRTPVHYIRSKDTCHPIIAISPLPKRAMPSSFVTLQAQAEKSEEVVTPRELRAILSITLTEDLPDDDPDACRRWLASFTLSAADVTVEAVFKSCSTVILISVPVATWDYLPDMPGCNFVCFATSRNLLGVEPKQKGTAASRGDQLNPNSWKRRLHNCTYQNEPRVEASQGGKTVESTIKFFMNPSNPEELHKAEGLQDLGCEAILNQFKMSPPAVVWPQRLVAWLGQRDNSGDVMVAGDHKNPLTAGRLYEELKKKVRDRPR